VNKSARGRHLRLNPNFRTELSAATEESLRINKSNGSGNFMSIQEMVAKANRLKLARSEDIVPNDCRLRARGSEVTGSSPDHSASAAEEPRPPLQSPTPPRELIRLLV
jgi:hypothetical protein